jgi:hypothetical protein
MHPQPTNIQALARDAHQHTFETAGALELCNEHSGSDATSSLL